MEQQFDLLLDSVPGNSGDYITHLCQIEKVRPCDVRLAEFLANENEDIKLVILLLLNAEQNQHSCLELERLNEDNPFSLNEEQRKNGFEVFPLRLGPDLYNALVGHPAIGESKPLALLNNKLYSGRNAEYERILASRFRVMACTTVSIDESLLQNLLTHYFPHGETGEIDWQKVACATAAIKRLSIITGGPGTGKTTTVTKLLAILQSLYKSAPLNIKMVAPTGKAAARLSESIKAAKHNLNLPLELAEVIPEEAKTIHRLMGVIPYSNKFRHNQDNPLHLDVLIVDEASMVDLSMMAKLVKALPAHARLILLGDKDQLASVDTGCVLGDLCQNLIFGQIPEMSSMHSQILSRLCGIPISSSVASNGFVLKDCLSFLQKSHRFSATSGIGQLAYAINTNDWQRYSDLVKRGFDDIAIAELNQENYIKIIEQAADAYEIYLRAIVNNEPAQLIHDYFGRYRLLCAVKEGPYGTDVLNKRIEQRLLQRGLVRLTSRFYLGMPIMVTQNDYQLKLYNGDIGILMLDESHELKACFVSDSGEERFVYPARLPKFELAYVMTIHKSQGSEFDHTAIILPPMQKAQAGINRQLLYTGVTRAKKRLQLCAQSKVVRLAMARSLARSSGLYERLVD
ncbi:Exodeoxyribonuclease V alpha chain [Pseudoalteromonas luteoviolacea B = ATCC 29581]|nr:Exodeoxyribonuclease V alpha chain [Pseudoalteromonas luteoviolacea B = ATCC 29581]